MSHPVIAIIGRVNVGKSTLFNRLVKKQQALVADFEGVTIDRQYGHGEYEEFPYSVIDTGGFLNKKVMAQYVLDQVNIAIEEANVIFIVLDAKQGLQTEDEPIIKRIRALANKFIYLIVNKADNPNHQYELMNDFYKLGIPNTFFVSAISGRNCYQLIEHVRQFFKDDTTDPKNLTEHPRPYIGFVGRPNAGKSTLVNAILGENRMATSDTPGTTKESIFNPLEYGKKSYTLIDTPGVRKRRRINHFLEQMSISTAIRTIYNCDVVLVVIDATRGVGEQDINLISLAASHDKEIILLLNKKDILDEDTLYHLKYSIDRKTAHCNFLQRIHISAAKKKGLPNIFEAIDQLMERRASTFSTTQINRLLYKATKATHTPAYRNQLIRIKYGHQLTSKYSENSPLRFMVHGNNVTKLPEHYKRYLLNFFRKELKLTHNLIDIVYKDNKNPFV